MRKVNDISFIKKTGEETLLTHREVEIKDSHW